MVGSWTSVLVPPQTEQVADMANPYSSEEDKAESRLLHRTRYGQSKVTASTASADEGFFINVGPSEASGDQAYAPADAGGFIDIGPDY